MGCRLVTRLKFLIIYSLQKLEVRTAWEGGYRICVLVPSYPGSGEKLGYEARFHAHFKKHTIMQFLYHDYCNFYPTSCWSLLPWIIQEKHALHYKLNTEIQVPPYSNISCARCHDQLLQGDHKLHFDYCWAVKRGRRSHSINQFWTELFSIYVCTEGTKNVNLAR